MPGLAWDLNLSPDEQEVARHLSFSGADSPDPLHASRPLEMGRRSPSLYEHAAPRLPALPSIKEGDGEGQEAETPVRPSQRAPSPSAPVTSSAALYPWQGGTPHPTFSAPVSTSLVLQAAMEQQALAAATQAVAGPLGVPPGTRPNVRSCLRPRGFSSALSKNWGITNTSVGSWTSAAISMTHHRTRVLN